MIKNKPFLFDSDSLKNFHKRIFLSILIFLFFFFSVFYRISYISISSYFDVSSKIKLEKKEIRGNIYDRNGVVLAATVNSKSLYAEANKIKNEASNRGSSMHLHIEMFLKNRINESFFEENEQYKNMAKEIIDKGIKGKLEAIYGMETTLHYPEKYAGTADLVGIYQGQETIIDFKQANKPKKTDYLQDYFLQLGAYTLAHNVFYKTSITSGVILLCTVDNLFQDFKIDGAELIMYQNLFLERLKKFNELKNLP